jgi:hypothetical protein
MMVYNQIIGRIRGATTPGIIRGGITIYSIGVVIKQDQN